MRDTAATGVEGSGSTDGASQATAGPGTLATADPFFFGSDALATLADTHRVDFDTAVPFPHLVLDDFLPAPLIDAVNAEFPAPEHPVWRVRDDGHQRKKGLPDEEHLGPVTRALLAQFNSQVFLDFLSNLTGIPNLVPDAHFVGGGLHQIQPGGYLQLHKDFSVHRELRLLRRLNVIVYLNEDWAEEYGGHFEMWDEAGTHCFSRVLPIANRAVIFDTTNSYHGHPTPLTCPPDRTRRSMAFYYYVVPEAGQALPDGLVIWRRTARDRASDRWSPLVRDWMPPVLYREARKLKARRRRMAR